MSQQTTSSRSKGLSKRAVTFIVAVLVLALSISLVFNVQSSLRSSLPMLTYVPVQMTNHDWKEDEVSTQNNLFFVTLNVTLFNPNPREALVWIQYGMYDSQGHICNLTMSNTTEGSPWLPVAYCLTWVPVLPNSTISPYFYFYYEKPQNSTTNLQISMGTLPAWPLIN